MVWLGVFIAACGIGLVLALLMPRSHTPNVVAWIGALAALALIGLGVVTLFAPVASTIPLWSIPSLGVIVLHADALAGLFLLVTGLVFLPVSIFNASSLPRLMGTYNLRAYGVMYFALLASIAWILLSGDVFSFLVSWELMSILSYLLVTFEHEDMTHQRAGYLMLAVSEAGALAALLGFLLLAAHGGSLDFVQIKASAVTLGDGVRVTIFLLTFFGFGVKAGLIPVNVWLPGAYTSAPAAFVPALAGATLSLGLYGIVRVNVDLMPAASVTPGVIALIIGTASALVGILYATIENDMKTLLAHSSIENAGIITAGLGAGFIFTAASMPILAAIAFLVALYHLINHSIYKTLLFICTGVVDDCAGTRDLDRMGGLIRRMPWTALGVLVGVLSIAALPPFNGFVSEWLTLQTVLRSAVLPSVAIKVVFALCGAGLALTAALAVTCFAKTFAMGFLGVSRSPEADGASEATWTGLAPMVILAVCCLLLGVLPTYVIGAVDRAVQPIVHSSAAAVLVPPFFAGSAGRESLPPAFASEFHDLGAQVGEGLAPGPGLVILHRGGVTNPVVFAAAPTYLLFVLAGLLVLVFVIVRATTAHRTTVRRVCWDGGIRRLLPEMTYTATGFSNPVRVIFRSIFRPMVGNEMRDIVVDDFRVAMGGEMNGVHIVDRFLLQPLAASALAFARFLARMHHGRLNAYVAYALLSLLVVLIASSLF